MSFVLKVIAGPDQGKSFPIPLSGTITIGRGDVDTELTDVRVSRNHFRLRTLGSEVRLIDLGSKSGTLVNNIRVGTEQQLRHGDIIVVGETFLQLLFNTAVAPTAEPADKVPALPSPAPAAPARIPVTPPIRSTPARSAPVAQVKGPPTANQTQPAWKLAALTHSTLGHFTIGPLLGVGETGAVFRAVDNRDRSEVALKLFLPEFSRDEEEVQRFTRAARTIMPLHHLNLVSLTGAGREKAHCWLSMELIEGPSAAWLVQQAAAGLGSWQVGLRVLVHATRALIYLHGERVLHRNLTPENLLMNRSDGLVKVGDLITAKAQEGKLAGGVTREGSIVGNWRYLPPERTTGDPTAGDERSDLYSLGAVVYAVLTGVPPIQGKGPMDTLMKIREEPPIPPRKLQPTINPALEGVVLRLLAKEPEGRFADATELLRHLVGHRLME